MRTQKTMQHKTNSILIRLILITLLQNVWASNKVSSRLMVSQLMDLDDYYKSFDLISLDSTESSEDNDFDNTLQRKIKVYKFPTVIDISRIFFFSKIN